MKLLQWWRARLPRERASLLAGGGILLAATIYLLLEPVVQERHRMSENIPRMYQDLMWMKRHAQEIDRLRPGQEGSPSAGEAVTPAMVEEVLRLAGLKQRVSRLAADEEAGVSVAFEEVVFAELMEFLQQFRTRDGVRIQKARFRRLTDKPGMVEASIVLGSERIR